MSGKITNDGLNVVRDRFEAVVAEIGIGTGTTPPSQSDEELEEEQLREQVHAEATGRGEAVFTIEIPPNETFDDDLAEMGAFDGEGNLLARATHEGLEKADEEFELEYRLTMKAENK